MSERPSDVDQQPFDPPDDWVPAAAIKKALSAQARGEPFDEDELYAAVTIEAILALMSRGLDSELAERAVSQAMDHGDIRITYDGKALSIHIGADETPNTTGDMQSA